jgi:RNA polymerase sigma-70 factor (ECF subfamily)
MSGQDSLLKIRKGGKARQEGIAQLYRELAPAFLRFFMKHRVSREQAEDLVQETFVKITRACDDFRQDERFDAWAWKIARNCLMDSFRERLPDTGLEDDMLDRLAEERSELQTEPVSDDGLADCVRRVFREFSAVHPARAEALSLLAYYEWGVEEMAAFLGRTRGATREYLSQCRKLMRPFMENCRDYR